MELILVAFLSIWHNADDSNNDNGDNDDSKNDEDNANEEEDVEKETYADDDGNSDANNDIDDYGNCVSFVAIVSLTSHHGLKEEIVCFGLQFQGYKSSSRQGSMGKVAGRVTRATK